MESVTIVGAGLVGSFASILFAQRGFKVTVIERRTDLRKKNADNGRSINLALSVRGLASLKMIGMDEYILSRSCPMKGRMIHTVGKEPFEQNYGLYGETINSVDRKMLNQELLSKAEAFPNVKFYFESEIKEIDLDQGKVHFSTKMEGSSGKKMDIVSDLIVGADGAYSIVRSEMIKKSRMNFSQQYIEYGYKEILLPADQSGKPLLSNRHLHIWPHHEFMMIALPNEDGSFTCTLFFPFSLFDSLSLSSETLLGFYKEKFPDFLSLIGANKLIEEYNSHSVGSLVSIAVKPYHYKNKAVIIGDAGHAMVPFYGQGMNAGLEDVRILFDILTKYQFDLSRSLVHFSDVRYPDALAICNLSIENYRDMSSRVVCRKSQMEKKWIGYLHRLFPNWFIPQYSMVSFSNIPYSVVLHKRDQQKKWLKWILRGIVFTVSTLSFVTLRYFNLIRFGRYGGRLSF